MKSYKEMTSGQFAEACDEIVKRIEKMGEEVGEPVVTDGVINPERYLNAPLKVMWLLKEAISDHNWRYQDKFQDFAWLDAVTDSSPTITRVTLTSYGILHGELNETWANYPGANEQVAREALCEIAYVNIKKSPGEENHSYDDVITAAYQQNRALLKDQIALYDPDVVIFGNTMQYVNDHDFPGLISTELKKSEFNHNFYDAGDKLYIWAYHPGAWNKDEKRYVDDIVGIVRRWRKIK